MEQKNGLSSWACFTANMDFVWKESLFTVEKESGYEKLHLHSINHMTWVLLTNLLFEKKNKVLLKAWLITFCSYRVLITVASANQDTQETKSGDARLREAAEVEPSIHAVPMPGALRNGEGKWHALWVHKFMHLYSAKQPLLAWNWASLCGHFITIVGFSTKLQHNGPDQLWK